MGHRKEKFDQYDDENKMPILSGKNGQNPNKKGQKTPKIPKKGDFPNLFEGQNPLKNKRCKRRANESKDYIKDELYDDGWL